MTPRRISLRLIAMAFFPVSSEGTGVRSTKFAPFFGALVGPFKRAIRRVSEAYIASSVAHSLNIQVCHEI